MIKCRLSVPVHWKSLPLCSLFITIPFRNCRSRKDRSIFLMPSASSLNKQQDSDCDEDANRVESSANSRASIEERACATAPWVTSINVKDERNEFYLLIFH